MASYKSKLRESLTTPIYRAFLANDQYDHKIDIWAAGMVLYFMVTGVYFGGLDELQGSIPEVFDDSDVSGKINMLFGTQPEIPDKILPALFKILGTPTEETWPGVTSLTHWSKYSHHPTYKGIVDPIPYIPKDKNLCYAIIKSCLRMDPIQRPNTDDLLMCIKTVT